MSTRNGSIAQVPLKDYANVLQAVRSLPNPAPGKVRVFRGQNKNYPQMLASGSRPQKLRNSSLFDIATRVVAQDIIGQIDIDLELNMTMFWTEAIAQHYGPGSCYLDVTYSLDVALWFALHEYRRVSVKTLFGPGTKPDPSDIVRQEEWIKYPRWSDTAYLYVFDAPKWNAGEHVTHGQLIDLADAPPAFSSSPRIQAQSACLLAAGLHQNDDLSDCLAVPPIPVALPMTGAPHLDWLPEDLFPGPERDDWYRRFLSIPLVPQPDLSPPGQIAISHPLPVTTYSPSEQALTKHIVECGYGYRPALVYSAVGDPILEPYDPVLQRSARYALSDATVIVVETPVLFMTPPTSYDGWNQGLLWGDISDSVPVIHAASDVADSASLLNVMVEFSPLEAPSFTGEEPGKHSDLLRAAWVARSGAGLSATVFFQTFPSGDIMGATLQRVVLDAVTNTMRYEFHAGTPGAGEKTEWREVTDVPTLAKPLFIVLLILREVSPMLKAMSSPSLVVGAGRQEQKMIINTAQATARLLRVRDPQTSRPIHFLRGLSLDESFVAPNPQGGGLKIEGNIPYSELDPGWVRATVFENMASLTAGRVVVRTPPPQARHERATQGLQSHIPS